MKLKKSSIDQAKNEQSGTYISNRLRNPGDMGPAVSDGKDMPYGIIAILSTIIMIVVTVVLYLNWDAIKAV